MNTVSRPEWQWRVVEEQRQLDDKIGKLALFLANPPIMPKADANRLSMQLGAMRTYSAILGERIANFPKE